MTCAGLFPTSPSGWHRLRIASCHISSRASDQDVFEPPSNARSASRSRRRARRLSTGATSLNALATLRGLRYFTPNSTKRLVVVLTDGESQPVSNARLGGLFRRRPRSRLSSSSSGTRTRRSSRAACPSRSTSRTRPPGRRSTGLRPPRKGWSTRRIEIGAAASKARELLGERPDRRPGREGGAARARTLPRRRRAPPLRPSPVAPRPVASGGQARLRPGTMALRPRGSRSRPCTRSPGSRARGRPAGWRRRGRANRLVAGLRPAALPGPCPAKPAQGGGRAIDVRSVLSVPLDADRPVEERESIAPRALRLLGGDEVAGRALFRQSGSWDLHVNTPS